MKSSSSILLSPFERLGRGMVSVDALLLSALTELRFPSFLPLIRSAFKNFTASLWLSFINFTHCLLVKPSGDTRLPNYILQGGRLVLHKLLGTISALHTKRVCAPLITPPLLFKQYRRSNSLQHGRSKTIPVHLVRRHGRLPLRTPLHPPSQP